jgi:basic membrane protein A
MVAALAAAAMVVSACGSERDGAGTGDDHSHTDDAGVDAPRLKFVVNGTLGDKSFFDSAAAGLDELAGFGEASVEIIEIGYDRTKWRPGFEDAAADDDYDILIAGTFDSVDIISSIAPQYPDKKFWIFDAPVDYSGANGGCSNGCENVYSIVFKQNEGGYLAGLIAAGTVQSGELPGQETSHRAGVIGGAELPVIQDFVVGFEAGWQAGGGAPSDLLVQYVGGNQPFADPARAKDIANSMYGQGASIVWPVAGASSFGVFEAAVDHGAYVIGIDADQARTLTNAEQRAVVVTSILKNVGVALLDSYDRETRGDLPYGQVASMGVRESAVGIVDNDNYLRLVPEPVRAAVTEAAAGITAGTIVVPSALS